MIDCIRPPGYSKIRSGASEPAATISEVVTRVSSLKTEKVEDTVGPGDVPMTKNRLESTEVQISDFYAISMQYAFPNRSKLKECLAIV
jgi:hypothetical protein